MKFVISKKLYHVVVLIQFPYLKSVFQKCKLKSMIALIIFKSCFKNMSNVVC